MQNVWRTITLGAIAFLQVDDGSEIAVKELEEQLVHAQNHYLTRARCVKNGGGGHYWNGSRSHCHIGCGQQGESAEERKARESKEEKERQLAELKSKLETKLQKRVGRKERMAYFK